MTTKLYHHKTDGGAEYLCTSPVDGTDEGDLHTAIIRLDGGPELLNPATVAASELLKALQALVDALNYEVILVMHWDQEGRDIMRQAEDAIREATVED